jgi:hypothetical protein
MISEKQLLLYLFSLIYTCYKKTVINNLIRISFFAVIFRVPARYNWELVKQSLYVHVYNKRMLTLIDKTGSDEVASILEDFLRHDIKGFG